jgi:hypothetical protein
MATVWRYIVVNVDASLETLTSAERKFCHHTTTLKAEQSTIDKADNR